VSDQPKVHVCPACGRRQRLIGKVQRRTADSTLEYELHRCDACGHLTAAGPSDPALLKRVYSGHFHRTSQQYASWPASDSEADLEQAAPVVRNAVSRARMLRDLQATGTLLDVGAGGGFFVRAASRWFDAQGLDVSENAAQVAGQIGATVHCADFMSAALTSQRFDVVTMWDVLAGFSDPAAALHRAAQVLKPGGLLVLTVPDAGSTIARVLGRFWPLLIPPINLNYFTVESMQHLLRATSFMPQRLSHDKKRIALDFLVVKALRTLGLQSVQSVGIPSTIGLGLNLGDILTVMARRTGGDA